MNLFLKWLSVWSIVIGMSSFSSSPDSSRIVVLTFDDAVKSHRTFVAPLLQEYGFGATFFISQSWMNDTLNYMSWEEIADLHRMGFEIGNHTWSHLALDKVEAARALPDELQKVDKALENVGIPHPVSFAWPGTRFGPESLEVLRKDGYRFARRGMQPEPPGKMGEGPLFDPLMNSLLLIPVAGSGGPDLSLEHFKAAVDQVQPGKAAILCFHGVPDHAHPSVSTPPERFKEYMDYLKRGNFKVIAMRDLEHNLDLSHKPQDPLEKVRFPE